MGQACGCEETEEDSLSEELIEQKINERLDELLEAGEAKKTEAGEGKAETEDSSVKKEKEEKKSAAATTETESNSSSEEQQVEKPDKNETTTETENKKSQTTEDPKKTEEVVKPVVTVVNVEAKKLDLAKFSHFGDGMKENGEARKKFNALDIDNSGYLEADELMIMCAWVWGEVNEGEPPTQKKLLEMREAVVNSTHKGHEGEVKGMDWSDFCDWFLAYTQALEEIKKSGKDSEASKKALAAAGLLRGKEVEEEEPEKIVNKEKEKIKPVAESEQSFFDVLFQLLDTDQSGYLENNELKNLYPKLTDDPAPYLIEYFDTSEDGKISREELKELFDVHHTGDLNEGLIRERIAEINETSMSIEKLADLFFQHCEDPESGVTRFQFAKLYSEYREQCDEYFGQPLSMLSFTKGDANHDKLISKSEFVDWLHAQDKNINGIEKNESLEQKEEAEELAEVAAADNVNEEAKANLAEKLADKMNVQKQHAKDEKEEAEELAEVAAADNVNEEAKENLAEQLAEKMSAQKQHVKAEAEEVAELKEVAAADIVNEEAKENLAEKLADKMNVEKQHAKDEKEEAAELAEVAAADNVNEESKKKLEEQLQQKKEKETECGEN